MSDTAAVLFANEAFYLAFAAQDLQAMGSVWASETPVTCIHPGWCALTGRQAVMESWRAIFADANVPCITSRNPGARLFGDLAYVLCHEAMDRGFLIATNIFIRENGPWKMIHHQAAPTPPPTVVEPPAVPVVLQ